MLRVFTCKCASRNSGVQIFLHQNFQKWSNPHLFCAFSLANALLLQRRAIFRHQNFKKWSDTLTFLAFWLVNVLLATAACNFSTSELQKVDRHRQFFSILTCECNFSTSELQKALQHRQSFNILTCECATAACNFSTAELQKVFRTWRVLHILTSKCAFRRSGVQFLISLLNTYLRTRRFNRPTFRLTRRTNHWKNTAFRDFSNIWRGCIFFLLTFALLHLLSAYCRKLDF